MSSIFQILRGRLGGLARGAAALACLAGAPAQALSPDLLVPRVLHYEVYRGDTDLGSGEIELKPAGSADCWFYSQQAKPKSWLRWLSGDVLEQSNFCVADGRIKPVAYRYNRDGVGASKENFSLRFDWAKGEAVYQNGDVRPVKEGTLDRLNLQLALRDWILTEKAATGREPTGEHEVVFADRKKIDSYMFQIKAHEQVKTPAGTFDTVRLDRTDSTTRRTQFWLSPEHGYIVVKAEQQKEKDPLLRLMLNKMPEPVVKAGK